MDYLALTKSWLEKTIIGLNLCPFAKTPYEKGKIIFSLCENSSFDKIYQAFIDELGKLNSEEFETTLFITPNASDDFFEFNDFIGELEALLEENDLSKIYQLVGFHPKFIFDGMQFDEPANYVNRSPFPLIHILKTESIEKLNLSKEEAEAISTKNEKTISSLESKELNSHFNYLVK